MTFLNMPERVVAVSKQPRREFRVVAVFILPQRVVVVFFFFFFFLGFFVLFVCFFFFFLLLERFRSLSVTYIMLFVRPSVLSLCSSSSCHWPRGVTYRLL